MEYKAMARKELAAELKMSRATLNRKIAKMCPEIKKAVFNKSFFYEHQVKYIYDKITDANREFE